MASRPAPIIPVSLTHKYAQSQKSSAQDLCAIQKLLLDHYNNALQNELDRAIEEKNISREDFEKILSKQ